MNTPPLSVLVVDDDPDTTDSLADLLELCGFTARTARSGADALGAAADLPDVIILDIRMPGVSGLELVAHIAGAKKPPLLLATTGCGSEDDKRRSTEAGIHLHLVKPSDPAVLIGVLRRFAVAVAAGDPNAKAGTCLTDSR